MIQQVVHNNSVYIPEMQVVKGISEYQQEINRLACIAWQIAYTSLWNSLEFSADEKGKALDFISDFLYKQTNHRKAYTDFVQRVLLARQYISSHPGTYAPIPSQWFNPANKNGFAGTLSWLKAVEATRASMPKFKEPLKAFSEAVLETIETASAKDFHYWRAYFIEHNCQGLLNLYLSTLANYLHTISPGTAK